MRLFIPICVCGLLVAASHASAQERVTGGDVLSRSSDSLSMTSGSQDSRYGLRRQLLSPMAELPDEVITAMLIVAQEPHTLNTNTDSLGGEWNDAMAYLTSSTDVVPIMQANPYSTAALGRIAKQNPQRVWMVVDAVRRGEGSAMPDEGMDLDLESIGVTSIDANATTPTLTPQPIRWRKGVSPADLPRVKTPQQGALVDPETLTLVHDTSDSPRPKGVTTASPSHLERDAFPEPVDPLTSPTGARIDHGRPIDAPLPGENTVSQNVLSPIEAEAAAARRVERMANGPEETGNWDGKTVISTPEGEKAVVVRELDVTPVPLASPAPESAAIFEADATPIPGLTTHEVPPSTAAQEQLNEGSQILQRSTDAPAPVIWEESTTAGAWGVELKKATTESLVRALSASEFARSNVTQTPKPVASLDIVALEQAMRKGQEAMARDFAVVEAMLKEKSSISAQELELSMEDGL